MRVISGKLRGKKLLSPQNQDIRPTLDKVKESLFNILGFNIRNSTFMDLFSGSGAIGIEALSRDAKKVIFIDNNKKSCELTKKNLLDCKFTSDKYQLLNLEAELALFELAKNNLKFDYIFMDPPYRYEQTSKLLIKVSEYNLMNSNGIIVVETDVDKILEEGIGCFRKIREKKYSISKLSFYERTDLNG